MTGYWQSSFLASLWREAESRSMFMERGRVEVHKHAKIKHGQYPVILASRFSNKGCSIWLWGKLLFFLWG